MNPLQLSLENNFLSGEVGGSTTTSILLILIGFFYCFFGYRVFKVVLFLTGAFVGAFSASLLWDGAIGLVIGALLGGLLSVLLYIVGVFILGALFGAGIVVLFALPITGEMPAFVISIFALIGGVIAVYVQRIFIILCTSAFGGAMVIYAIDILLSGVRMRPFAPNTFNVVHVIGALVLLIAGMIIQFSMTEKTKLPESQVQQVDTESGSEAVSG